MHPRYSAPIATKVWSDEARLERMTYITDSYTINAIWSGVVHQLPTEKAEYLAKEVAMAEMPSLDDWKQYEEYFGHEVVGFLQAYLNVVPEITHPYVHYGLTSSDLVEYDTFAAMALHANNLAERVNALMTIIAAQITDHGELFRAGRTHGQTAEMTTLGHQLQTFILPLMSIRDALDACMIPIKTPGPTGYSSRTANFDLPLFVIPSTQIIPRDLMLVWASWYLRLSNICETLAMFVRLGCRSEIGEFSEGAYITRQGSSAMPGKKNPIDSEKVCGLARIARGNFMTLSEISALWEDRDLSNSSTERVTIPSLGATVEHMVDTMIKVMDNLVIHTDRITQNAQDPRTKANAEQCLVQKNQKVGPIEASRIVAERMKN